MARTEIARRTIIGAAAGAVGLAALGGRASAQLAMPKSPVALNVVDAAGTLALVQPIIENYRKANPHLVSRIAFSKASQPELPGKIKAQQDANSVDIDLVLAGYDGLTGGFEQKIWLQLEPNYAAALPKLDDIYLEAARRIQEQTKGQGICVSYSPYGPLLEYMPARVKQMPSTAEDLLAWARENKHRFMYSRMSNSGPARAFVAGLPYILGDSNPRDPSKGWDKTWAYLKVLGETIEYYPSSTAATMKEFGEGSRDIVPTSLGFDIYPRVLGIVPKEAKTATLKGFHWLTDANVVCIPKGVSDGKLTVLLDLIKFMLTPQQQAYTYDSGYNYPGPAVKGVTLDMAPEESQKVIKEFGRTEYPELIANNPQEVPLTTEATVTAFRIWDQQIGAGSK
jgi:putative spermidine/putrescine transport system substrate-binding protein